MPTLAIEFAKIQPTHPWKLVFLLAMFVLCLAIRYRGVWVRRRKGASWNDALAEGKKCITGSVWLDGALLAFILLGFYFGLLYLLPRI